MGEAGSSRNLPGDGPETGVSERTNARDEAPPTRPLIADDHALLRTGMRAVLAREPDLWLSYNCPSNLTSNGFVGIKNTSAPETVNAFSDNGLGDPCYNQLVPDEFWSQGAAGEHIVFQVEANTYVATVEVFSVHRTSDNKCHVQALVTKP